MRLRFSRPCVLLLCSTLFLVSCGSQTIQESGLPGAEVMRLAAQKSRELLSARFAVDANFKSEGGAVPLSGTVTMNGILNDGGASLQFNANLDALTSSPQNLADSLRITASSDVMLLGKRDVYIHLNSFVTEPDQALIRSDLLSKLLNTWWLLPSNNSGSAIVAGGPVTPSSSLLKAQSQVVRVIKDDGLTVVDGRKAYHEYVDIDREKLLQYLEGVASAQQEPFDRTAVSDSLQKLSAEGEMWIDAETYALLRVTWRIGALQDVKGGTVASGTLTVSFSDFNTAPLVSPPADAKKLTPALLLGSSPSSSASLSVSTDPSSLPALPR